MKCRREGNACQVVKKEKLGEEGCARGEEANLMKEVHDLHGSHELRRSAFGVPQLDSESRWCFRSQHLKNESAELAFNSRSALEKGARTMLRKSMPVRPVHHSNGIRCVEAAA